MGDIPKKKKYISSLTDFHFLCIDAIKES